MSTKRDPLGTDPLPRRTAGDEALRNAAGLLGGGEDVETARTMGSGDDDTGPELPDAALDVDDIRNANRANSGLTARDGSDVGAPWDRIDDGARRMSEPD